MSATTQGVRDRQAPLRQLYTERPEAAIVHKRVRTRPSRQGDPYHYTVTADNVARPDRPYGVAWELGQDHAVGGLHDLPNPGELLCAALAVCEDATIRMIADILGIHLEELEVEVNGEVDVRGTLNMDRSVPVGFRSMSMSVHLRAAPETPHGLLERLCAGGERLCVNLQTLRQGVPVTASFAIAGAPATEAPAEV